MTELDEVLPVTLANCEDEPIHQPGAIQPHGALLALNGDGVVLARSGNFAALAGFDPLPGGGLPEPLGPAVTAMLREGFQTPEQWIDSAELQLGSRHFDVIGHNHAGVWYLELEPRATADASFARFALYKQRIINQIQRLDSVDELLVSVVGELFRVSGFDRVMAYRFKPDQSGEVVAETHREGMESYLGQHYPASDIPHQARRLYTQNPIRAIADVSYRPVSLQPQLNPETGQPFDLSFSTLRSVSPIHCEYLSNMGVAASMSISLVVGGKLWGMFACHHRSPRVCPYPMRAFFQVVSYICSAMIERLEINRANQTLLEAGTRMQALMRDVRSADDMLLALAAGERHVGQLLPCDGAAVVIGGRVASIGGEFDALALDVVKRLAVQEVRDIFQTEQWRHGEETVAALRRYCGVMAICFYPQESGWVLWFRREQIESVRWGGRPEKSVKTGPLGSRLTPRGSFDVWEEVVRGCATPWSGTDSSIAEKLRGELVELSLQRAGETDRMRQRLIAILGHDLRNPLQSISMAAAMLKPDDTRSNELRQHIRFSTNRMDRTISQILEMSRLQSGVDMALVRTDTDISELVRQIVAEAELVYPGVTIHREIADGVRACVDVDRYGRLISNLLSNAYQYGKRERPVRVVLGSDERFVRLCVRNASDPLPEERLATLFQPFRQLAGAAPPPRGGLGIGLYICEAITLAHQGHIHAEQHDGELAIQVTLPR